AISAGRSHFGGAAHPRTLKPARRGARADQNAGRRRRRSAIMLRRSPQTVGTRAPVPPTKSDHVYGLPISGSGAYTFLAPGCQERASYPGPTITFAPAIQA